MFSQTSVLRVRTVDPKKSMHRASTPISHPQSYELAISRMKRGGVEVIIASHILQASPGVISTSAARILALMHTHAPGPSTLNSSPLIQHGCSRRCPKDSTELPYLPNLEESLLSVTGLAARQSAYFVALSQSHSYLKFVPLGQWWHTLPNSACTICTKGSALCTGAMRKSWFQWRTCEHPVQLVLHEVWRDTLSDPAYHFIWFLLPPVLHFPLPLVGISFSQDQVTWLQ